MKKLLLLIVAVFSLTAGFGAQASAATRYWSVTMSTPTASSTNHTLNIAYNVLSTIGDDTFTVTLFQNNVSIDSQLVDHPPKGGNSGAFSVTMPTNGTYSYKIQATNNEDTDLDTKVKTTDTKAVKIVDGPTPTVTTVTVNTAAAQDNGAGAVAAAPAAAAAGEVAGAATATGQNGTANGTVNADGSNKTTDKSGDVLGSQTAKAKAASDNGKWYGLGAGALVLGGAAYYWLVMRRKLEE
jgi:VCBS repeat-containing protein